MAKKNIAQVMYDGAQDSTSPARLAEILNVLRRNEITKGVTPERFVKLLEDLGPTFIKFGQLLSARSDMLPPEYCEALKCLRSSTTPEPFESIDRRLNENYDGDWHTVFSDIDEEPLGSASVAQVHAAHLRDGGDMVAVKIRRDHVREDMLRDIQLLRRAADLLNLANNGIISGIDLNMVINELERTVREEVDFNQERSNLMRFARNCENASDITCPKVYPEYSNEMVLVMEFIDGLSLEEPEKLSEAGYNLRKIGDRVADAYMRQMVEFGFLHADPHAANIIVRPTLSEEERAEGKEDPGEIVWIDCGMMGELSPYERHMFFEMMKALVAGDSHTLTDLFIEWGRVGDRPGKKFDYGKLLLDLTALVNRYSSEDVNSMDIVQLLNDLMSVLDNANVTMPPNFVMLVRGLASLQGTLISLSPEISILAVIERYVKNYMARSFDPFSEAQKGTMATMKASKKMMELPERLSNVLDLIEKGRLKMGFDLTEAAAPMEKLGHIMDKLSLAIITAGLFVGSSTIYAAGMDPKLFGVPVIGFLGYCGAAVLSVWIVWRIYRGK